jgi:hypothetical protein
MYQPLDGPSIHGAISVGAAAVVEAKVGVSAFEDRKVITIQPSNKIFVYFANEGETPSVSDIQNRGFEQFKDSVQTYEAGSSQKVFLLSASGTVTVRIAERA